MEIYTIGFTKRTAADFFETLRDARIERLIDIRLRNDSQLAGFAKKEDLRYFLHELLGADYVHEPLLAPTPELLRAYRKRECSWDEYEDRFFKLMEERKIEDVIDRSLFDKRTVLLCSEPTPDRCHRRLVVDYLSRHWGGVTAHHLIPALDGEL